MLFIAPLRVLTKCFTVNKQEKERGNLQSCTNRHLEQQYRQKSMLQL